MRNNMTNGGHKEFEGEDKSRRTISDKAIFRHESASVSPVVVLVIVLCVLCYEIFIGGSVFLIVLTSIAGGIILIGLLMPGVAKRDLIRIKINEKGLTGRAAGGEEISLLWNDVSRVGHGDMQGITVVHGQERSMEITNQFLRYPAILEVIRTHCHEKNIECTI